MNPLNRSCPKCGALPQEECFDGTLGKIAGLDTRVVRSPHSERLAPLIIHNKRPTLAMNQPLQPEDARAHTTMEQICGGLCRVQMHLDFHATPGHQIMKKLVDAFNELQDLQLKGEAAVQFADPEDDDWKEEG
jgi:hypothetical protein